MEIIVFPIPKVEDTHLVDLVDEVYLAKYKSLDEIPEPIELNWLDDVDTSLQNKFIIQVYNEIIRFKRLEFDNPENELVKAYVEIFGHDIRAFRGR